MDGALFQILGWERGIAVARVARELIGGKPAEEALAMGGSELSARLGRLPPVKIHCAQLVEGALRSALSPENIPPSNQAVAPTLLQQFQEQSPKKIVLEPSK